jgi:hypothetical protein
MRAPRAAAALVAATLVAGAAASAAPTAGWLTTAERTNFQETPRLAETVAYLERLEKASPWIRVTSFGTSPEGRDLVLVVAAKGGTFDPAAAARAGKAVVLVQAGIHAGEIDGKDAGMMLLRDIAVTKTRAALLDHVVLLFMPIYNVDGHERFGPYNRINQNGPREAGWRTTARNLNLNRDYMKADAPETRAWLKVFTTWWPDFFMDSHVTDGADFRYDITYALEMGPNVPQPVAEWLDTRVVGSALPAIEALGHRVWPYIFLKDDTDPAKGQTGAPATPRFAHGYTILQNRPCFLIETHMLKDYGTRVRGTYDSLVALLETIGADAAGLRDAVRRADTAAAGPGTTPLVLRVAESSRRVPYEGVTYRREPSGVSGAMRVIYGREPIDLTVDRFDTLEVTLAVERPHAYLVPKQWTDVIAVLRAHGLRLERLTAPVTLTVDGYRLVDPKWQEKPFEGRHPVTFKAEHLSALTRTFPEETVVVPLAQRGSAVAVHLLDPQGPDSFAAWGFFDSIFEQKEFAEDYVLETMARDMLEKDAALRRDFEAALTDRAFAADPKRRLDFFFRRSPWWDDRVGLYPVGIVTRSGTALPTRPDTTPGR